MLLSICPIGYTIAKVVYFITSFILYLVYSPFWRYCGIFYSINTNPDTSGASKTSFGHVYISKLSEFYLRIIS